MRVTKDILKDMVRKINRQLNASEEPCINGEWQVGSYYLDQAYGGNRLVRVCCTNGSVRDALETGYVSKKELFKAINIYRLGMRDE